MLDLKQIESFYPQNLRPFKKNLLREYLQYKILGYAFNSKFADKLCFMGGTAIHIIHANDRFSEDLDFDNLGLAKSQFEQLSSIIQRRLRLEGHACEIDNSFAGAWRSYIRITDILYQNGLSAHKDEKLLIQFDTEPQKFSYSPNKVVINKFDVFTRINVVPIDTLLAQKIYAIFGRKRAMGRDFYDAIFLFGKASPNFDYLRLKLGIKDMPELKKGLMKKCKEINFKELAKDVEQFLFSPADAKKILLFPEFISSLAVA